MISSIVPCTQQFVSFYISVFILFPKWSITISDHWSSFTLTLPPCDFAEFTCTHIHLLPQCGEVLQPNHEIQAANISHLRCMVFRCLDHWSTHCFGNQVCGSQTTQRHIHTKWCCLEMAAQQHRQQCEYIDTRGVFWSTHLWLWLNTPVINCTPCNQAMNTGYLPVQTSPTDNQLPKSISSTDIS